MKQFLLVVVGSLAFSSFVVGAIYLTPWKSFEWGKMTLAPMETVTAVGESKLKEKTQIASFTAGVAATKDNKDEAVAEVDTKIKEIVDAVRDFGVPQGDIQTQNMSVYQQSEIYYEEGRQKTRPGQWNVSNNVQIILRNVDRAKDLASLLTKSGATNVYGPSFSLEDITAVQNQLLGEAFDDAKKKAEVMASVSGKALGKVINIAEGGAGQSGINLPLSGGLGGGGGGGVEPGTATAQKTVTVTFELK